MKTYYEQAAENWYQDAYKAGKPLRGYSGDPCPWLLEFMRSPYFPRGGKVMDFACWEGIDAIHLAQNGCTVVGLDIVADAIDKARNLASKRAVSVDFRVADMSACPELADSQFDLALAIACFGWLLEDDQRLAFLRETARVLKPGGWLFFQNGILLTEIRQSFPEVFTELQKRPDFDSWLEEERSGRYIPPSQRYETREGYERLLESVGYRIIHSYLDDAAHRWGVVIWARKASHG